MIDPSDPQYSLLINTFYCVGIVLSTGLAVTYLSHKVNYQLLWAIGIIVGLFLALRV